MTTDTNELSTALAETAATKSDNVVRFEKGGNVVAFAKSLGVQLEGSIAERADLAAMHSSASTRHEVATGLLLLSIKSELQHGDYLPVIEARGFDERAARRAIACCEFVLKQDPAGQTKLLEMPKSKVAELAKADPEVVQALLGDDDAGIDLLSVRALRDRIKKLEAESANLEVDLETTEAELETLKKRTERKPGERDDKVPSLIADLRAEVAAEVKKADLACDDLVSLLADLEQHDDDGPLGIWVDPTARLALAGVAGLMVRLNGIAYALQRLIPEGEHMKVPPHAFMSPQEVIEVAQRWAELTAAHSHEKAMRDWERKQAQPKGRGRPTAKPDAKAGR